MKDQKFPNKTIKDNYVHWAVARRGTYNPSDMTNPVWTWMIKDQVGPYEAKELLGLVDYPHHPLWSCHRYGQTETVLPDGRRVLIAGEYEDSYDEDFYIYNDVIVISPEGKITIYGYKEYVFPPTDNHSATLADDKIYIIGCLGYPHQRKKDSTPVYCLRLKDFRIWRVEAADGEQPHWLCEHQARLSDDGKHIICEGGEVRHHSVGHVENLASWQFELETGQWTKLSEKDWTRWVISRSPYNVNELRQMSQLKYDRNSEYLKSVAERGHEIDMDLYTSRHIPPLEHRIIGEDEDNFRIFRVEIDDVILRIVESSFDIKFHVEGQLSKNVISQLKSHYLDVYARLEGVPYKLQDVD